MSLMTHPLGNWLDKKGIRPAQFARLVGVQPSFVSMMLSGKRGASLPMAVKMSEATKGELEPADFLRVSETAQ